MLEWKHPKRLLAHRRSKLPVQPLKHARYQYVAVAHHSKHWDNGLSMYEAFSHVPTVAISAFDAQNPSTLGNESAVALLRFVQVIDKSEYALKDRNNIIRLCKHSDSSLTYAVYVWIKKEDYWNAYFELNENIKEAFDKNNIEIPFPQLDIHQK